MGSVQKSYFGVGRRHQSKLGRGSLALATNKMKTIPEEPPDVTDMPRDQPPFLRNGLSVPEIGAQALPRARPQSKPSIRTVLPPMPLVKAKTEIGTFRNNEVKKLLLARRAERFSRSEHRRKSQRDKDSGTVFNSALPARQRLGRLFRFVRLVCSLSLRMQQLSRDLVHDDVISQLYFYSANGVVGDRGVRKLAFDPADYSRRKRAQLPQWAREIADKQPRDRTEEEMYNLGRLLKSMRSFQEKFTDDMRHRICRVVRYTNCEKGRVVVRQGHPGCNFFFIYSGSVFIQKETLDQTTGRKHLATENIIDQGLCFGELALLSECGERTATVVCRERTELLTIDRDTFDEICPNIFRAELEQKVSVARRHPVFDQWPTEVVTRLCFQAHIKVIPHGKVIETDWSNAQHIYFVVRGNILLLREFSISAPNDISVSSSAEVIQGKSLPKPSKSFPGGSRLATVGALREGDLSDLRVLTPLKSRLAKVIMLSQGTEVLRMSVAMVNEMAPRGHLEEYLRFQYIPLEIPPVHALYNQYLQETSWETFKADLVHSLRNKPSTKETPAWARWPCYRSSYTARASGSGVKFTPRKKRPSRLPAVHSNSSSLTKDDSFQIPQESMLGRTVSALDIITMSRTARVRKKALPERCS